MGENPNTNKMTKSKQQTQLVSNYLTEKQINSIKVECSYTKNKVSFNLLSRKRGVEYFETNSNYDDIFFTISTNKNECTIKVGNFITFYSETKFELLGEEFGDIEVNLIKLLLKHFTQSIGNSVYIK